MDLSSYRLNDLSTYKRKDYTTMIKNKNVKKTLEAGALTKRHSEDEARRISYLLKRFFAKYKFQFDGNCVKPAQNDGKFLAPQCLSNLVPFSPLSLPSPSSCFARIKRIRATRLHPLLACAWGEGSKNVMDLSSYRLNDLTTNKRKDCTTMKNNNNVKNLFTHSPIHLFTSKKLVAFTLAEVLITLGIIGVVAAMTIPNLMFKYYEHQTVSRLLETQSILTQAFRSAEEEFGEVSGWGITGNNEESANIVGNNIKHFLKLAADCGTVDKSNTCYAGSYSYLNGVSAGDLAAQNSRYKIALLNGTSVSFVVPSWNHNVIQINIDTNGPAKPNVTGRDSFLFGYNSEEKALVAMGAPSSIYSIKSCNKKDTGVGCAYWILQYKNMDYLK